MDHIPIKLSVGAGLLTLLLAFNVQQQVREEGGAVTEDAAVEADTPERLRPPPAELVPQPLFGPIEPGQARFDSDDASAVGPRRAFLETRGSIYLVIATIAGPFFATLLALLGQRWLEARRQRSRSIRVWRALHREIEANLRTADTVWDRVGTRSSVAAERLQASRRLSRQEVPVWEREAYTTLLPELPDAISDADTMAAVAEHYSLLRRMDWGHRQLRQWELEGDQAGDITGDRRLATWAAYAEAYARLGQIGNPLPDTETS